MSQEFELSLVYRGDNRDGHRYHFLVSKKGGAVLFDVPAGMSEFGTVQSEFFRGKERPEWNDAIARCGTPIQIGPVSIDDGLILGLLKFRVSCTV